MANRFIVRDSGSNLFFHSGSDKIDCGVDFIGENAGSITAWVKLCSFGGANNGRILSNGKIELMVSTPGRIAGDTNGTGTILGSSSKIVRFGHWYFITFTWDQNGLSNLYMNAVLNSSADVTNGAPVAGSTNLFIGGRSANDRGFHGYIDEVRIFDKVLSANEISALYFNNKVPTGCVAEYLFNEGSGSLALDTVGNHHGTITGASYTTKKVFSARTTV